MFARFQTHIYYLHIPIYEMDRLFLVLQKNAYILYFFTGSSSCFNNHGRHGLLSFLSALSSLVLCNLKSEANTFYDRARSTRCYFGSEVNDKRHLIKIPFINKRFGFYRFV